jgi:hypothetical protein
MAQSKKQYKDKDPVIGLISGRMVMEKDREGKLVKVFKPMRRNPNPTLAELRKLKSHRTEDDILSFEKLRLMPMVINYEEFAKSDAEKAKLKEAKKNHKSTLVKAGFNPSSRLNIGEPQILRQA